MEYVYAALLLHRAGKAITEEHLEKVITSTGAKADEAKIKTLIASLKGVDIDKELENATLASVAAAGAATAGKEAKAEKKEEPKAEEAAEGLSALFG